MPTKIFRAASLATLFGGMITATGWSQQAPQYPQQQPYPQGQQAPQYPPQQQQQQYPSQDNGAYPATGQYPAYPPQQYPPGNYSQPPALAPQQLDQLVGSIALYPDGLLAHVLTAATFPDQIPAAAGWANQHAYLRGDGLARAIQMDNLPWDVSVMALIPFPQVLGQLSQNMQWTQQLGDAVLVQRGDVMDAVQRMRARANQYGYFNDPQFRQYERVELRGPNWIEISSVGPNYFVPYYDPVIFYRAPRPGFYGVFRFGAPVTLGASFGSWGWGGGLGFGWREHTILFDRNPWNRTWVNRGGYAHPYAAPYRRPAGPPIERHDYQVHRDWERRGPDRDRDHR